MLVSLYITTKCNLRCSYCYVDKSGQRDMELSSIDKVIAFIKKMIKINHNKEVVINFFGGEPLLRLDFIQTFIEEAEKSINLKKKYLITTNGTLLSKGVIDFLKEKKFSVSLSIDGPPEIHDKERRFADGRPSWESISGNLGYLLKNLPNTMARLTFHSQTCGDIEKSIRFMIKSGFRLIKAVPDYFDPRWKEEDISVLEHQFTTIRETILEAGSQQNIIVNLFDAELKHCGDCKGGCTEISIDSDGNIFPCTYSVEFPQFSLGNIESISAYHIPKYHIEEQGREACRGCTYFNCCISGKCLFLNYKMSGKFNEPNGFFCAYQRLIYSFCR